MSIVVHYSATPSVDLTVYAYDSYLGYDYSANPNIYIDGDWVGQVENQPLHLQLPMGEHTITFDYTAYVQMWGNYGTIVEVNGNFNGYYAIYSLTPVDVYLTVTPDTEVNAVYSVWV